MASDHAERAVEILNELAATVKRAIVPLRQAVAATDISLKQRQQLVALRRMNECQVYGSSPEAYLKCDLPRDHWPATGHSSRGLSWL